jgi:APA family basic amino acid/polyamine antiporter
MGADYPFLKLVGLHSPQGVPRGAVLVQGALALLMVLAFNDPGQLILYVEFLLQVSIFLTVLSVIVLRHKQPDLHRPVRVWAYPFTPILFLCWIGLGMGFFLFSHHEEVIQGLITLAAGLLVYWICRAEKGMS